MAGARPLGPLPGPLHRHSSIQTESSRLCPTTCWLSKLSCSESGTQTGPDAGPKTSSTQPSSCLIHTALILTSRLPATSPQRRGRAWLGSAQHLLQGLHPRNHGLGHSHPGRKQPREEFPDDICQPCPAGRVLLIQGSQGCGGPTRRALPSLPPAARGKARLWRPRGILPASHRPGLSWPNALVPLGAAHLSVAAEDTLLCVRPGPLGPSSPPGTEL